LDSFNTGVQTGGYTSPLRRPEELELSAADAEQLGLSDGQRARISSRRGSITAPVRIQRSLRRGLAFMTLHFPDDVETNVLTINATDPKSGTAEFKATAIRVDRLPEGEAAQAAPAVEPVAAEVG
jgi:formate dehydrogenase major subunit